MLKVVQNDTLSGPEYTILSSDFKHFSGGNPLSVHPQSSHWPDTGPLSLMLGVHHPRMEVVCIVDI